MSKLFWGAIFAFLNFNLNFGDVTIGLLPGFIGWFLIWKGLTELRDQSVRFGEARIPAVVLTVYSAATYMLDLFAITPDLGWAGIVAGLLSVALALYVMYGMIRGILDLGEICGENLNGAPMLQIWKIDAVLEIGCFVFSLLSVPAAALILMLAVCVLKILLLIQLHKVKKIYENRQLGEIEKL